MYNIIYTPNTKKETVLVIITDVIKQKFPIR